MSIFSVKNDKDGNPVGILHSKLNYVRRAGVTDYDYMYGAGISVDNAFYEMMLVKEIYNQYNGKGFYHYVFSPSNDDVYTLSDLYDTGIQIAELIASFEGHYQVLMTLHYVDERQPHIHLIANNIDMDTGRRLDLNRQTLVLLKCKINGLIKRIGLSPIIINSNGCENDGI